MVNFNPRYLLLLLPALLSWFAQAKVREVYNRHRATPIRWRINGLEVARRLLDYAGLANVAIERVPGTLTDHYDPQAKVLRLSQEIIDSSSVTALGIVAHEVGHAAQDAEGYHFMQLRTRLAKPVGWLAQLSPLVFIGGMWFGLSLVMIFGGLMLVSQVVFTLVTLPVERNASGRAVKMLEETGLAGAGERRAVWQVLRAAALTYATALGRQLASFLFFVSVVAAARGA